MRTDADLELVILPPQPPEYWDQRYASSCLAAPSPHSTGDQT